MRPNNCFARFSSYRPAVVAACPAAWLAASLAACLAMLPLAASELLPVFDRCGCRS